MGHAPHAKLCYGYDLGMFNAYSDDAPAWLGEDDDRRQAAYRALLAAAGVDVPTDAYTDEDEVFEQCGVYLEAHGDGGDTCYILSARTFETDWEDTRWIPEDLNRVLPDKAHDRLDSALEALGIRPSADGARWLLAAFYEG